MLHGRVPQEQVEAVGDLIGVSVGVTWTVHIIHEMNDGPVERFLEG